MIIDRTFCPNALHNMHPAAYMMTGMVEGMRKGMSKGMSEDMIIGMVTDTL